MGPGALVVHAGGGRGPLLAPQLQPALERGRWEVSVLGPGPPGTHQEHVHLAPP